MRNIHLVSPTLEKKYGRTHTYDVSSVGAAIRLLEANRPGFKQDLRKGMYKIVRGKDADTGENLFEDQINMNFGSGDFFIVSVLAGSSGNSKGIFQIVVGVVLVAAAFYLGGPAGGGYMAGSLSASTATSVGMLGASLILGGIATLMAPALPENMNDRKDERTTFTFGGAVNRTEQGRARPLIFGRFMVGSYIIESSLKAKNT